MKKIFLLLISIVILNSCSSAGNEADVTSDKIIGVWKITSQKVNGLETADNCRKQTTFTFEDSRVLRQVFFRTENNVCEQGSEIISSWFNLGNSSYRINGSDGSRLVIDVVFTDGDTAFSTNETDVSTNTITTTVFEKF